MTTEATDTVAEQRAILYALEEVEAQLARSEAERKALWQAFYAIADAAVGEGHAYRFLDTASDPPRVLARIIARAERIDDARLAELLTPEQWEAVTLLVRQLDPVLLEAAIRQGTVEREIVAQAAVRTETVRRHGPRRASKEDIEALEAEEAR